MKPSIAITLGDPLGIGAEIVKKALKKTSIRNLAHWKIFGEITGRDGEKPTPTPRHAGQIAWQALDDAVTALKKGDCDALVTAPVSKTHLQKAGFAFPGQTEYLAHTFKAKKTAMMLMGPTLKVTLVTIHLPLKKIFSVLTPQLILEKIILTDQALRRDFGIKKPKIAVCGLNPHAGENGLMGNEEGKLVTPSVRQAVKKGVQVTGPLPPDTIFYLAREGKFDAVIALYHDQGLIPVKTLDFHQGVNTTLGLPIIRTSPDHGCAFDIAGKGVANPSSMIEAMKTAVLMWRNRKGTCLLH